jgi:hypothetical protein
MAVFCLILGFAFLSGCTWVKLSEEGFNRVLLTADAKKGVALRMADYTSFSWDHIRVFGPGTANDTVTKDVGRAIPFPHSRTGGFCLLVFTLHGEIQAAFELETKVADFSKLYRKAGYTPVEAVFTFENGQFYQWRNDRF